MIAILAAEGAAGATPCSLPVVSSVCNAVGGAAGAVGQSAAALFVDKLADGFSEGVKGSLTFWMSVSTPQLSTAGGPVEVLHHLMFGMQAVILVMSLMVTGVKIAFDPTPKSGMQLARGMGIVTLASTAGTAAIDTAVVGGDMWSRWIIENSAHGSMATQLGALTGGSKALSVLGMGLEFNIALIGQPISLVQIALLIARGGVLILLVGALPLLASGSLNAFGNTVFVRALGWIVAFVFYKPAAAMVYAAAFALTGHGTDLVSVISGLTLMLLAILALPALMKLVQPAVAATITGGSAGSLAGAVSGVALAAGAKSGPMEAGDRSSAGGSHSPGLVQSSAPAQGALGAKGAAGTAGGSATAGLQVAGKAAGLAKGAANRAVEHEGSDR
ncbi:hypothetical protein [Enterococcus hirae]|uniref:hypothetical protein n=1 Tax=Enterococcus hirae TaxID=1354 RepID=UPI0013AC4046|nr:hypothetical protein [Enterococcus hirae]NAE18024.1 hypothetical protein [Enterococcus hirae]